MTQMLHDKKKDYKCDRKSAIKLFVIIECHVVDKSSNEQYLFVLLTFKGKTKIVKMIA